MSRARVYADVNTNRSRDYWDYKSFTVPWGDVNHYEVGQKLGEGGFSEVYDCKNVTTKKRCIMKKLKREDENMLKKEIKILQNLSGCPNITKLLDVVRGPNLGETSLIMEYAKNQDYTSLYPRLTAMNIRYYIYDLLKALDYCHSQGIMHRDVKPENVMIDHHFTTRVRLIDWGLAEFYHPGKEYSVWVGTRFYKGPELLVDLKTYDYSLDMWSLGCMFAEMIFKKERFFNGQDDQDQLIKIAEVLGTEKLHAYLNKYKLNPQLVARVGSHNQRDWASFRHPDHEGLASDEAIDFLDKLLRYDHEDRLTAKEAMAHPFFKLVREAEERRII